MNESLIPNIKNNLFMDDILKDIYEINSWDDILINLNNKVITNMYTLDRVIYYAFIKKSTTDKLFSINKNILVISKILIYLKKFYIQKNSKNNKELNKDYKNIENECFEYLNSFKVINSKNINEVYNHIYKNIIKISFV
tara:strand:+ start:636 stop:1052 length:417 start_codon:yes stop_codon:yes gene_type:complete